MEIANIICTEDFTSRVPGLMPAYNDGELYYFTEDEIVNRDGEYPSDYAMLPMDIVFDNGEIVSGDVMEILSGMPDTTKMHCNHDERCNIRISFSRIQDIYAFCRDYEYMIENGGNCDISYSSATHYYSGESSVKEVECSCTIRTGDHGEGGEVIFNVEYPYYHRNYKFVDDLMTVGSMGSYEEMDKQYKLYKNLYKWVCKNIIPSFEIKEEYYDVWKTKRLYAPDVRRWIGWFAERKNLIGYSSPDTCSAATDCCDCERYWSLGGENMLNDMRSWYTLIQSNVSELTEEVSGETERPKIIVVTTDMGISGTSGSVTIEQLFFIDRFETENVCSFRLIEAEVKSDGEGEEGNKIVSSTTVYDSIGGIDKIGENGYQVSANKLIKKLIKISDVVKIDETKKATVTLYDSSFGFIPRLTQRHRMESNVFDLGDESIFCEAYDERKAYHLNNVVDIDGDSMRMKSLSGDGSSYCNKWKRKYIDMNQWEPYYDAYIDTYMSGDTFLSKFDVSGTTSSRLLDLRSNSLLTDDIGNTLEGTYDVSQSKNHQPSENEVLGLMYQVGNTSNVSKFHNSEYYIGDIITSMSAFTVNVSGGREDISIDLTQYSGDAVYCDIEYAVGATLELVNGSFRIMEGMDGGVKYKETVRFVKTMKDYYLKAKIDNVAPVSGTVPMYHSVSYPIYVWELRQNVKPVKGGDYREHETPMAEFSMTVHTTGGSDDMEVRNGTTSFPTFRYEYNLGISSYQNVDADIYIDRGVNSAFESHLKLGEINSLDDLTLYNNGFFSIMES